MLTAINEVPSDSAPMLSTSDVIAIYRDAINVGTGDHIAAVHDVMMAVRSAFQVHESERNFHNFDLLAHVAIKLLAAIFEHESTYSQHDLTIGGYLDFAEGAISTVLDLLQESATQSGFKLLELIGRSALLPSEDPSDCRYEFGAQPSSNGFIQHTRDGFIPSGEKIALTCHGRTYYGDDSIGAVRNAFYAISGVITVEKDDNIWDDDFASWSLLILVAAMIQFDAGINLETGVRTYISQFSARLENAIHEQRRLTVENGIQLFSLIGLD